ncbi:hypothetical protein CONPUDRAFT_150880 [Coniophora puteana RWD-64-598 SS2]|uniref:F-box domain-containing protein n=1 Tax=Coniophora puteana (strain RWD-64-598) TaxID=741705 RepID=A0A5M3MXK1_CONPW|nr:uncharacterized protein CONPUDRAFT_150880 [Coniophora puteana RWD-64-598 SS2]EIW83828.1 hypothetical protein CONPUDRAFT_150880 [Coniophora puteana RWD-64-598 SS2]
MTDISRRPLTLITLPVDILYTIVFHLSSADILTLRQVCMCLSEFTKEHPVWTQAYRASPVIRPPGPSPLQSREEIERSLLKSMRVDARSRNTLPYNETYVKDIKLPKETIFIKLLFKGTWLLLADHSVVRSSCLRSCAYKELHIRGSEVYSVKDGYQITQLASVQTTSRIGEPLTFMALAECLLTAQVKSTINTLKVFKVTMQEDGPVFRLGLGSLLLRLAIRAKT